MKKTRILALILMLAMLVQIMPTTTLSVSAASGDDTIVLYPEYDEKIERDYMYRVYVKQGSGEYQEIPVYNSMMHPNYNVSGKHGTYSEVDRRFCQFSANATLENPVFVKVVVNTDMTKYSIIPSVAGIESSYSSNEVTFKITNNSTEDGYGQYVFRINDNDLTNVAIFADEVETDAPSKSASNVVVFNEQNPAPNAIGSNGTTYSSNTIFYIEDWQEVEFFELQSGQQLYIAPGAVLNSRVQIMEKQSDIKIFGRGMLRDFNDSRAYNAGDELLDSSRYYKNLLSVGSYWTGVAYVGSSTRVAKNVNIKDIILYDATGFNLAFTGAINCTADNIKVISNEISTDGVSVFSSKDITVKNSYLYVADNIFVIDDAYNLTLDNLLVGTSIATFFPQSEIRGNHNYTNINVFRSRTLFEPNGGFKRPDWESSSVVLIENLCAIDCVAAVNPAEVEGAVKTNMGRLFSTFSTWGYTDKKNVTFRNVTLPSGTIPSTVSISHRGSSTSTTAGNYNIVLENVYQDTGDGKTFNLLVYDATNTANNNVTFNNKSTNANASTLTAGANSNYSYTPITRNVTTASYTAYKTYLGTNNWTGRQYYSLTEPYVKNSITYVSAKTTAELFGFNTYFDEDDKSLTIYDGDVLLRATAGSNVVLYNDTPVTISADVEYTGYDEKTKEIMVPMDFFSKTLGVSAARDTKKITIGNYDRVENLVDNGDFEDVDALESWDTVQFARLTRYLDDGNYVMRFADKSIFNVDNLEDYQGTYRDIRNIIMQNGTGVYRITFKAKCNETTYDLTDTTNYYIFATLGNNWLSATSINGATKKALKNTWTEYTQDIVVSESTSVSPYSKAAHLAIIINGPLDVSIDDITFTKISDVPSTTQTNSLKLSDSTTTVNYGSSKTLTISGTSASSCTLSTTSDYLTIVKSGTSATVSVNYPSNYDRTARIIAKDSSGTVTGNLVVTIPATTTDKHVVDFDTNLVVEDSYTVGDTLDTSGLKLTNVLYNDSTTATVDGSNATVDADFSTAGDKTITVTYDNKSVSYTVTVKEPEVTNDAGLKTLGANIRLADDKYTAGLRVAATLAKNELYDKYYPTTDENKTYKYKDDNNYQFGTIMIPEKLIPEDQNVISVFMNEETKANVLEIVGKGIWEQDAETITFTGVLVDIPKTKSNYTTKLQAAFYVRVRNSATDEWEYYFSDADDIVIHSYYSVAAEAAEKKYNYSMMPNPTEEQKATIKTLNEIIEFVEKDNWITGKWW